MSKPKNFVAPVEDYGFNQWLNLRDDNIDQLLVAHGTIYKHGQSPIHAVMLGLRDPVDTAVTTLTVEQARGLATLLLYQAKLSEERNNA